MRDKVEKPGRPRAGEERERLEVIHVCIDGETRRALDRLEREIGAGKVRGARSLVVRRAIREAAERLG